MVLKKDALEEILFKNYGRKLGILSGVRLSEISFQHALTQRSRCLEI